MSRILTLGLVLPHAAKLGATSTIHVAFHLLVLDGNIRICDPEVWHGEFLKIAMP